MTPNPIKYKPTESNPQWIQSMSNYAQVPHAGHCHVRSLRCFTYTAATATGLSLWRPQRLECIATGPRQVCAVAQHFSLSTKNSCVTCLISRTI